MNDDRDAATLPVSEDFPRLLRLRSFHVTVTEGPDAGRVFTSAEGRCAIGSHEPNDLVLDDPTVSRFHCEIVLDAEHARVRDLGSLNGTVVQGVTVREANLRSGYVLRLGKSTVRFDLADGVSDRAVASEAHFGSLSGGSVAMRRVFTLLERVAATHTTVLLEGETGTGKGRAAQSIHEKSARKGKPFVVVDCGAIPGPLLESELFGHEKGAFTGAHARRIGAIEGAAGGTLFLDELGELPADLQPKLLRVLEEGQIRRLGANTVHRADARIIAATNRDLRAEVNAGRFRPDLYFRLAVVKIVLPPLRERAEDIPLLSARLLRSLGADDETSRALLTPPLLDELLRATWAGNVRELRNYLERCLVFREPIAIEEMTAATPKDVDASLPYTQAKELALADFERRYVESLLRAHGGKVSAAATSSGLSRVYLYRLIRRHHIVL